MFKILIVDDDSTTLTYLKKLITSSRDCNVFEAENGLEGLRVLEKETVDAVFMDISMPIMDGLETLEAIRNNPKLRELPIMMLSAVTSRSEIEKALHLKVFDYLLKPLLYHETLLRIQRFFEYLDQLKGVSRVKDSPVRNRKVLIISGDINGWNFLKGRMDDDLNVVILESPLDGIEFYMKELPGIVVIDNDLKLMNDKLVAKKIKNVMQEHNGFGMKNRTSIIGMNMYSDDHPSMENFDFNLKNREDLLSVVHDLYKIK